MSAGGASATAWDRQFFVARDGLSRGLLPKKTAGACESLRHPHGPMCLVLKQAAYRPGQGLDVGRINEIGSAIEVLDK